MKTLLVTDIPPCNNFTAGLVLDQLCRFFEPTEIACFCILAPQLGAAMSPDLSWIPSRSCRRPFEGGGTLFPGKLGSAFSFLTEKVNEVIKLPRVINEAISFGKEIQADRVWCVLQGQTMVRVARPIAKGLDVPLLVQVWDPLEWWLRAHKVNSKSCDSLLTEFSNIMRNCQGCFTASPAMAADYKERYGVRSVHFVPSLDEGLGRTPAEDFSSPTEFTIAMAGQLYAKEEWNALLLALKSMSWEINGKAIKVLLVGKHDTLDLPEWAQGKIKKTGWVSQAETIDYCHESDLLYCPYWFSESFKDEARLSFPSKLTTYLASGRPVFFHGPEYSSPSRFIIENGCGFVCQSNNVDQICLDLKAIASDKVSYSAKALNGTTAFQKYMTTSLMRRQFKEFIGF